MLLQSRSHPPTWRRLRCGSIRLSTLIVTLIKSLAAACRAAKPGGREGEAELASAVRRQCNLPKPLSAVAIHLQGHEARKAAAAEQNSSDAAVPALQRLQAMADAAAVADAGDAAQATGSAAAAAAEMQGEEGAAEAEDAEEAGRRERREAEADAQRLQLLHVMTVGLSNTRSLEGTTTLCQKYCGQSLERQLLDVATESCPSHISWNTPGTLRKRRM